MLPLTPIAVKCGHALLALVVFVSLSGSIYLSGNTWVEIKSWDGNNIYEATINGKDVTIHLEDNTSKRKEYEKIKNKDGSFTEKEIVTENNTHKDAPEIVTPGTVKIVYKDNKTEGITFVYDRDMSKGEISAIDQKYLDKAFEAIEKFHEKNNTINEKLKDYFNGFKEYIKKK